MPPGQGARAAAAPSPAAPAGRAGPCRAPAVQRGGAERRGRCEEREPGTTTALPLSCPCPCPAPARALPLSLPRAAVARRGGPGARPLGRAPLLGTPSALPPRQDPAGNERAPLAFRSVAATAGARRGQGTPRGAEPPSGPELLAPGPASPAGKRGRIAAQSRRQPGLGVRRGLTRK